MRTPAGQILLGRLLARRLFPLTLGIGLLISIGFPAIYFVIEFAAVTHTASIHAANLATQAQGLVLEAPGLWKYQTYKIEEIYRRFLAEKDVAVVRILDETGRTVAERDKEPPTVDAWWEQYAPVASADLMFNARRIGTVQVGVSLNSLVSATLKLLVIFTTVGAGLSTLAYFYPVRVVTGMEGQIHDLLDTVQRSNAQIRSLNVDLEQRVLERTAQLAERERELHEAKAFLEHVIVSNPAIVLQGDPTGTRQTYVSPNVQRVLGYTPEEVLDDPVFWINHIHPEDRPDVLAKIQGAMGAREAGVELEYRFLHKDGRYRWLHTTRRFEYDESGNVVSNLGFPLDVTERKLAEDGVRKARDEAERANRAKSEFLSRMSHELRTPLNAVLGFAQILEMNVSSPQQRKAAQHIIKGGQHLLELINEVLDIARIEVGRLALSPEPVSLPEVVQETLALIMPLASQRGVSLDGELAQAGNGYVRADRQRLKQVLLNLLSNAVKYNHKGGKVGLACEETPQGRIRINVTDTGPGIPRSMMGRLFTPFERLNADQSGVEGTGIGLALSKRLVELMGGTIEVESEVGQGSTFWVELAPAEGPLERIDRTLEDPSVPREAHTPTSARAVLYIEDNLPNLELVQHVLADRPDVRLLAATQGRLGLEMARQHRPDLILLDLHLPDITGDEILRRLQEDSRSEGTPVVVISADATPGQIERLLAAGARAYLTKPLDVRKFITVLDEALNEREALGHT